MELPRISPNARGWSPPTPSAPSVHNHSPLMNRTVFSTATRPRRPSRQFVPTLLFDRNRAARALVEQRILPVPAGNPATATPRIEVVFPFFHSTRFTLAVYFSSAFHVPHTPHAVTAAQVRQVFVVRNTCHATDRQAVYSRLHCAAEDNRPFRPPDSRGDTRTMFQRYGAERRRSQDLQPFASRLQPRGTAAPVACACLRLNQHPRR